MSIVIIQSCSNSKTLTIDPNLTTTLHFGNFKSPSKTWSKTQIETTSPPQNFNLFFQTFQYYSIHAHAGNRLHHPNVTLLHFGKSSSEICQQNVSKRKLKCFKHHPRHFNQVVQTFSFKLKHFSETSARSD